jgi:uncharacterized LabA/DUF88 family protein
VLVACVRRYSVLMTDDVYAFIDGNSFCKGMGPILADLHCEFDDIDWQMLTRNAQRIFYFDALPTKKEKETGEQFEEKLEAKKLFFSKLRRVPNLHVREGVTRFRRDSSAPDLTQKGVDVALAVEVLSHVHRGNISRALLFTGDLDFYPLLDTLTSTSARSELLYFRAKTARELIEAADVATELNHFTVCPVLPPACTQGFGPSGLDEDVADYLQVASGTLNGRPVTLSKSPRESKYVISGPYESNSTSSGSHMSKCKEVLIQHLEACAKGSITWRSG